MEDHSERTHRLLKNSVAETLGLHGYALFTAACLEALKIDPATLGMRPHAERYEHIGDIPGFVHDVDARWRQEQETRRDFLAPEEADLTVRATIPAPAPLAWDFLTTPEGYRRVAEDITRLEESERGRRGVGTTTHCVHGDGSSHMEEILDWRPFDYFTYLIKDPEMGQIRVTAELIPANGETQLRYSVRMVSPEARAMMEDPARRETLEGPLRDYRAQLELWFAGVAQAAGQQVATRREDLEAAEETRRRLAETAAHYWQSRESWVQDAAASSTSTS